jgi:YkoY family integral membrane protein
MQLDNYLAAFQIFGQTFESYDLVVILLLIVLEGVLSIDNALVLGLLAKRLPKHQQSRALTYGLVGAFVFRIIAIATATYLLKWQWVKLLGGGYLVYIAVKHLFFESKEEEDDKIVQTAEGELAVVRRDTGAPVSEKEEETIIRENVPLPVPHSVTAPAASSRGGTAKFWPTVFVIEMTDIAFAIDSILAAIALVGTAPVGHTGTHPKLWVVVTGGMLGVILMRFASVVFIRLLERFPRFEMAAYLLVIVIGGKLLVDWGMNSPEHPHRVDFHNWRNPAFWVFWVLMAVSFVVGFLPSKKHGGGEQKPAGA